MMGVFAEFERSIIHERVMAGLARARPGGIQLGRRPTVTKMPPRSEKQSGQITRRARAFGRLRRRTGSAIRRARITAEESCVMTDNNIPIHLEGNMTTNWSLFEQIRR
jgi:DNA invertase Pin-like site-specific DNA recombinase